MVFRNPCRKCLIQACCTEICEIRYNHMITHTKLADNVFGNVPVFIAICIALWSFLML
ncbi:MAG: hypothetical protein ACFFG0_00800 [Candidatus Thorarchaeota archaeon]